MHAPLCGDDGILKTISLSHDLLDTVLLQAKFRDRRHYHGHWGIIHGCGKDEWAELDKIISCFALEVVLVWLRGAEGAQMLVWYDIHRLHVKPPGGAFNPYGSEGPAAQAARWRRAKKEDMAGVIDTLTAAIKELPISLKSASPADAARMQEKISHAFKEVDRTAGAQHQRPQQTHAASRTQATEPCTNRWRKQSESKSNAKRSSSAPAPKSQSFFMDLKGTQIRTEKFDIFTKAADVWKLAQEPFQQK